MSSRKQFQQPGARKVLRVKRKSDVKPTVVRLPNLKRRPSVFLGSNREYACGKKIGSGTYGVVYLGTRTRDGLPVAIKRILSTPEDEEDGVSRGTLREIGALKRLKHPGVVDLIDVVQDRTRGLHLVFEQAECDLRTHLDKQLGKTFRIKEETASVFGAASETDVSQSDTSSSPRSAMSSPDRVSSPSSGSSEVEAAGEEYDKEHQQHQDMDGDSVMQTEAAPEARSSTTKLTIVRTPSHMSAANVKNGLKQILTALAHCHALGFVHRDLKPQNILVMAPTHDLKIADFGLSRGLLTMRPGMWTPEVVTLWYRCPSILFGNSKTAAAMDLWSVGMIFGEMITGTALAQGDSEIGQIIEILKLRGTPQDRRWLENQPHWKECLPQFPGVPLTTLANMQHHSPHAPDLLARLLTFDPVLRITAADALEHPYFTTDP